MYKNYKKIIANVIKNSYHAAEIANLKQVLKMIALDIEVHII